LGPSTIVAVEFEHVFKSSAIASRARPPKKFDRVRGEILVRAAEAFRARGFHGTGMREIAAALGMTVGNLYHYFPRGKADLLFECQRVAVETLLDGARAIDAEPGAAPDKLAAIVRLHVRCLLEETGGSAAHLEFRALPAGRRAAIAKGRDAYEAIVRRVLRRGVASGELRPLDEKLTTLAILCALNATVSWWRPDGDRAPGEIAESFAKTLVGGLLP
jgi:AcrR family transcriptional regulator